MPVGEMLRRMDSREITEWRAFFLLRANPAEAAAPTPVLDAASQSALIKQTLFRMPS